MKYKTANLTIIPSIQLHVGNAQPSNLKEDHQYSIDSQSRVLILALSGIGDALMMSPAIRVLKQTYPELSIDLLTMFKGTADIFNNNNDISTVHYWDFLKSNPFSSLSFIASLRGQYSHSITAFPANRWPYPLISFLIGAPIRLGHHYLHVSNQQLNFLYTDQIHEQDSLHNCEENIRLVSRLGAIVPDQLPPMQINLNENALRNVEEWKSRYSLSDNTPCIGIHAGSAIFKNQIHKRWDYKKYAELSRKLIQELGYTVLLFGGPEELELNQQILHEIGMVKKKDSVIIVTLPNLMSSIALMKECKAFIANDSGLMHIAAALQLPMIAIFGYTSHIHTAPWQNNQAFIARRDIACSPCFYFSPRSASCKYSGTSKEFSCIRDIQPEDIYQAILPLIQYS